MTIIIPSRTISNLIPCVNAIQKHEPDARIIVVDDGLGSWEFWNRGVVSIPGVKPFVYARNVNLGIVAAGDDDVVLLNDDAILKTPGGLTIIRWDGDKDNGKRYGVIAATCNNVGNVNQHPKSVGLRYEPRMVCFVAVYIPRSTIDKVGLLDERFTGYGSEDDDYCRRVREAGLKIGIHDGCYVDHGSLRSTFRGDPKSGGSIVANKLIYRQKWGDLN